MSNVVDETVSDNYVLSDRALTPSYLNVKEDSVVSEVAERAVSDLCVTCLYEDTARTVVLNKHVVEEETGTVFAHVIDKELVFNRVVVVGEIKALECFKVNVLGSNLNPVFISGEIDVIYREPIGA